MLDFKGAIRFNNVLVWRERGERYIDANVGEITFDFKDIERTDSSALTLMLCWMRFAQKRKKQVRFTHVPANLCAVAAACNLTEILSLK